MDRPTQDAPDYSELLDLWCEEVRDWDGWDTSARLYGVDDIPPVPGLLEPWLAFMRAYRAAREAD